MQSAAWVQSGCSQNFSISFLQKSPCKGLLDTEKSENGLLYGDFKKSIYLCWNVFGNKIA